MGVTLALLAAAPLLALSIEVVAFGMQRPALVALTEQWVGAICHHLPDRTLHAAGRALPVCARCTGLYGGAAVGGLFGVFAGKYRPYLAALTGAGVLAMALGGLFAVAEALSMLSTSNAVRVGLGGLLGTGPTFLGGLGARILIDEGLRVGKSTR